MPFLRCWDEVYVERRARYNDAGGSIYRRLVSSTKFIRRDMTPCEFGRTRVLSIQPGLLVDCSSTRCTSPPLPGHYSSLDASEQRSVGKVHAFAFVLYDTSCVVGHML